MADTGRKLQVLLDKVVKEKNEKRTNQQLKAVRMYISPARENLQVASNELDMLTLSKYWSLNIWEV